MKVEMSEFPKIIEPSNPDFDTRADEAIEKRIDEETARQALVDDDRERVIAENSDVINSMIKERADFYDFEESIKHWLRCDIERGYE